MLRRRIRPRLGHQPVCTACKQRRAKLTTQLRDHPSPCVMVFSAAPFPQYRHTFVQQIHKLLPRSTTIPVSFEPTLRNVWRLLWNKHDLPSGTRDTGKQVDALVFQEMPFSIVHALLYYILVRRIGAGCSLVYTSGCGLADRPLSCFLNQLVVGRSGLASFILACCIRWSKWLIYSSYRRRTEKKLRILVQIGGGLGDQIRCVPCLKALRHTFPDAFIYCLATKPGDEMFVPCPYVDEVGSVEHERRSVRTLVSYLKLAAKLRSYRFTSSVMPVPGSSVFPMYVSFMAGIKRRIGGHQAIPSFLLTYRPFSSAVLIPRAGTCRKFLEITKAAGARAVDEEYELWVHPDARPVVSRFLAESDARPLVVVHPGSSDWSLDKKWPPKYFAEAIDGLQACRPSRVVLTGNMSHERAIIEEITSRCKSPVEVALNRFSWIEMLALIEQSELLITNDTGPMHAAIALKTPVVAVFGPTDPGEIVSSDPPGHCRLLRGPTSCPRQSECRIYLQEVERQPLLEVMCTSSSMVCPDAVGVSDVVRASLDLLACSQPKTTMHA